MVKLGIVGDLGDPAGPHLHCESEPLDGHVIFLKAGVQLSHVQW